MANIYYDTPGFLKPYQENLNSWLPSAPKDAVWSGFKSHLASSIATVVMTRGNAFSMIAAQPVSAVASLVYAVIVATSQYAIKNNIITLDERQWSYVPHLSSAVGLLAGHFFGKQIGIQSNLWWTCVATTVPYVLTQSFSLSKDVPPTPLLIAVVV